MGRGALATQQKRPSPPRPPPPPPPPAVRIEPDYHLGTSNASWHGSPYLLSNQWLDAEGDETGSSTDTDG